MWLYLLYQFDEYLFRYFDWGLPFQFVAYQLDFVVFLWYDLYHQFVPEINNYLSSILYHKQKIRNLVYVTKYKLYIGKQINFVIGNVV